MMGSAMGGARGRIRFLRYVLSLGGLPSRQADQPMASNKLGDILPHLYVPFPVKRRRKGRFRREGEECEWWVTRYSALMAGVAR
jgi:hypothetical protein